MVEFYEVGAFMSSRNKADLDNEIEFILDALNALKAKIEAFRITATPFQTQKSSVLKSVRRHYDRRKNRDGIFNLPELFGEPAWDMLLELYIAAEEGRQTTATHLCMASGVPVATARRWLAILESHGFLEHVNTHEDAQHDEIVISAHARERINMHFETIDC